MASFATGHIDTLALVHILDLSIESILIDQMLSSLRNIVFSLRVLVDSIEQKRLSSAIRNLETKLDPIYSFLPLLLAFPL